MTRHIERIERAYAWLLTAPVILPVIFWNGLIYPYLVPKTLLFYALSFIAVGVFAVLVAQGHAFYWARLSQWETWIPASLLVLAYGTSMVGIDFYRSFWSLFVRGDGLLMLSCSVGGFYLILLSADKAFFDRLLRTVAVVASFVATYGIIEWLMGGGRIGSLLGNAAFFAGYLGIAFFATLASAQTLSGNWRRAAYVGAVLQVIAIVLTATRGTILAFVLSGVAYLMYLAIFEKGKQRTRSVGALIMLLVIAGSFFAFRVELAKAPFAPIARIASISTADSDVSSRLFVWKNMVTEIGKSPWLGVGAEHIDVLFNRFYDPTQISEQWFDRSHNAFLDYTAQYGIGGLLLYLALIGAFVTTAKRIFRHDKRIAGLFTLLAVTYAAQNFFVFDTISSWWLLLALLAGFLAVSSGKVSRKPLALPPWAQYVAWPLSTILILLIVPVSVRPAIAAYDLAHAYSYQLVDVAKEVGHLSHGIALSTYGDLEYGYTAYDMYANNQLTVLTGQARIDAYQIASSILAANFNHYPYDARTALYFAHMLSLAPEGVRIDESLLSSALDRAMRLSPKRLQPWYILANLAINAANTHPIGSSERIAGYSTARNILNRYITLVPTLSTAHFVLAQLDLATGDTENAALEAAKGKGGYASDLDTARRAAGYYESVRDWGNAQFFLSEIVRFVPTDTASLYDLAKVTYLAGDYAGAEKIVARLRKENPKILETDQNFLTAITAYEQSKK